MSYICLVLAVLCGIVLLIKMDTGNLDPQQIAGIAVILICLGIVAPRDWPTRG